MEGIVNTQVSKNKLKIFFSSKLYTFMTLTIVLVLLMTIVLAYHLFAYDTFFNSHTDDVVQYYMYAAGVIKRAKANELSLYDTSLFMGASSFASVYYVPLDIFFGIAFLFSYIMPAEMAYFISNFLRIIAGSLVLYYVFARKGYKPYISLIISLIYFSCGIVQAEWVFPVYLGILAYVPVAMLLVDLFIAKQKKATILLPLYGLAILLYDYYIAYMLYAFLAVYYLLESHLRSEKFFLITKNFYIQSIKFVGLILLSLMLGAFILIPSAMYVINESNRAVQSKEPSIWYFAIYGSKKISISHYFTMLANYFIPNVPFNLCLQPTGGYIREHASLYMTTCGAIYLIYFFFTRGKFELRLKIWVVLFNLLFLIPLVSMIFTFNNWAYSRWFFIPYMINLYAVGTAMNKFEFRFGSKLFIKIIIAVFTMVALGFLIYIFVKNPEYFMHYNKDEDPEFYAVLIGSIIFLGIYLAITITLIFLHIFKKTKASSIFIKFIPAVLLLELLFSNAITYAEYGSTYIIDNNYVFNSQKEHLESLGYDDNSGYRINLYTSAGRSTINVNTLLNNTNVLSYFHSFYNTPVTTYNKEIHSDPSYSAWTRIQNYGYSLLSSHMTATKYIIASKDVGDLLLPDRYYNLLDKVKLENDEIRYYEYKDMNSFMIYDEYFTFDSAASWAGLDFHNDFALLKYGYVSIPMYYKSEENYDKNDLKLLDNLKKVQDSGINKVDMADIILDINNHSRQFNLSIYSDKYKDNAAYDNYTVYDLTNSRYNNVFDYDCLYFSSYNPSLKFNYLTHFYFRDKANNGLYPTHYNMFFPKEYPELAREFIVSKNKDDDYGALFGFNYDFYDSYLEKQNSYTDKHLEINKETITLSFTNYDSKAKVLKLPYAYSDDWKINNENYQTVNINGGFLGVIIPDGKTNIDLKLHYEPAYFNKSCILSGVGCIIYVVVITPIVYLYIKRKRNDDKCKESQL